MLTKIRSWLARPLAEDFSLSNHLRLSLWSGLYVFVFVLLLAGGGSTWAQKAVIAVSIGLGCVVTSLVANTLVPGLLPRLYDEERWTVGKHILHTFFVLLCVSLGNQLVLLLWNSPRPSFLAMYIGVTLIGFFPVTLGVFVAEQRRLKRNLASAQTVNRQLDRLHEEQPAPAEPRMPESVSLASENGKDQLSLLPNQLIYVESVGNYVEVHWLNFMFPQKTVLRSTLKEVEAALRNQPQFFRCHRAFLINLKAVNQTEGNARGYQLTMSGSAQVIPVSRSYIDAFNERMEQLV